MNNRLSHRTALRGATVFSLLAAFSTFALPGAVAAQTRIINLPQDMCNVLAEQPLNQRILSDVRNRANFADILAYVEANCGNLTGLLIGPTGSIVTPGEGGGGGGGGNGGGNGGDNGGTGNGGLGEPDDLEDQPGFDPDDYPDVDRGENDDPPGDPPALP